MTPSFQKAFNYVLGDEGRKYTNDPNDKGGPTKFGVTKKAFEAYFKREALISEIENMSESTAGTIYYFDFWKPLGLDSVIDNAISTSIFDCGVLYGLRVSANMTQKSLRACGRSLMIDGVIGPQTVSFLNEISAYLFLTVYRGQVLQEIDDIIRVTPSDEEYRHGWTNRANRLLALVPNPKTGELS